ncbi:hypothetical protein COO60DRAFT_797931 [Scenedesmus sp. NREL 46B-D3]|nr:hypothetical protein COO60DRAFT_797931 [Scenedesmus sp. NREL 46B-D3]
MGITLGHNITCSPCSVALLVNAALHLAAAVWHLQGADMLLLRSSQGQGTLLKGPASQTQCRAQVYAVCCSRNHAGASRPACAQARACRRCSAAQQQAPEARSCRGSCCICWQIASARCAAAYGHMCQIPLRAYADADVASSYSDFVSKDDVQAASDAWDARSLAYDIDTQWGARPWGGAYKDSNTYYGPGIYDFY